jgi:hypothetical protein
VSEKMVMRGIFGLKSVEVIGGRTLHTEELHNLCSSPNIVKVIKSRRMRWETCSKHGRNENSTQNFSQKS